MSAGGVVFRHVPNICLALGPAALRKVTLPPEDVDDSEGIARTGRRRRDRTEACSVPSRAGSSLSAGTPADPRRRRASRDACDRNGRSRDGRAFREGSRPAPRLFDACSRISLALPRELLGEFWKQDVCDFFEVTIGVGRLQAFMDRLAAPEPVSAGDVMRRALLIALPGETHLLGVRIVAKVLEVDRLGRDSRRASAGRGQCENGRGGMVRRSRRILERRVARGACGEDRRRHPQRVVKSAHRDHGRRERVGRESGACAPDRGGRGRLRRPDGRGCRIAPSDAANNDAVRKSSRAGFDLSIPPSIVRTRRMCRAQLRQRRHWIVVAFCERLRGGRRIQPTALHAVLRGRERNAAPLPSRRQIDPSARAQSGCRREVEPSST